LVVAVMRPNASMAVSTVFIRKANFRRVG